MTRIRFHHIDRLLEKRPPFDQAIPYPGLTQEYAEIETLVPSASKLASAYFLKQRDQLLWLVFMGGTGTGKSTLFNAFCGVLVSATGVERPKTRGALLYVHEKDLDKHHLLQEQNPETANILVSDSALAGVPGSLTVISHRDDRLRNLVVVDTPDLDSLSVENRQTAEDLYLLAEAAIFVTSQEKYADDVPYQFFMKILEEKERHYVLLNKAGPRLHKHEVMELFGQHQIRLDPRRLWLIPFAPHHPREWIANHPEFERFTEALFGEIRGESVEILHREQQKKRARDLLRLIKRLLTLLHQERQAAQQWTQELSRVFERTAQHLLEQERENFAAESHRYLQTEIRRLFARYDLLAGPRKFIRNILFAPFRLLGLKRKESPQTRRKALLRIRDKIDLTPILAAVENFNREVLERLSPADPNAPLFSAMREPQITLHPEEVRERIWREQERLADWLEKTFEELAQGIPKGKEWGIYSTSILWGILILAFETTVGGGFSVLDAALDSALAPFVTKGAMELFAYHEIQRVARQLAKHYQDGLLAVIREQRDRFARCMDAVKPGDDMIQELQRMQETLEKSVR